MMSKHTKPFGLQREFCINLRLTALTCSHIEGPMGLSQISASARFYLDKRVSCTYFGGKSGPSSCITGSEK
jgi:hypothetical protein